METLTPAELASLLQISPAGLSRMRSLGRIPEPDVLGHRTVRWLKDDIIRWQEAGMPPALEWQKRKEAERVK